MLTTKKHKIKKKKKGRGKGSFWNMNKQWNFGVWQKQ